jgi:hypothetical protein
MRDEVEKIGTVGSPAIVSMQRNIGRVKKRIFWIPFFSPLDHLERRVQVNKVRLQGGEE